MLNISSLITGMLLPSPPIARTEVNGLIVSTVNTPDVGPETAVLDVNGAHPVERYKTVALAKLGHKKWVKKAATLTTITKLGYGELVDSKQVTLNREVK